MKTNSVNVVSVTVPIGYRYLAFWGGDFGSDIENGQTFQELELSMYTAINGYTKINSEMNKPSAFTQTKAWTYTSSDFNTVMDGSTIWDSKLQFNDNTLRASGGVLFYMDVSQSVYVASGKYWTYTLSGYAIGSGKIYGTNTDPATFTDAQRIDPTSYTFICDLDKNVNGQTSRKEMQEEIFDLDGNVDGNVEW
jgi:hypothetical protein